MLTVSAQVHQRGPRAVRAADQVDRLVTERDAQVLEIVERIGRGVLGQIVVVVELVGASGHVVGVEELAQVHLDRRLRPLQTTQ